MVYTCGGESSATAEQSSKLIRSVSNPSTSCESPGSSLCQVGEDMERLCGREEKRPESPDARRGQKVEWSQRNEEREEWREEREMQRSKESRAA